MKTLAYLLTLWLVATTSALRAAELPVVFARSGQKATLSVGGDEVKPGASVALWTFGRRWGEPVTVKKGAAEFVAPVVRSPRVLQVMPADGAKVVFAELVVYPDRPVAADKDTPPLWDKNTQLAAMGTPLWFDTWAATVGLPLDKLPDRKALDAGNWRMLERPGLLIVSVQATDRQMGTVPLFRLAAEHKINVLVLDTDWFGTNETARDLAILPKQMTGALADLQTQDWSMPPTFRQCAVRICNRQTWIAGREHPLVEEIRSRQAGTESLRIVFSYLPWQRQLGRREMADALFLRLLTETAKGAKDRTPLDGRWVLLYPSAKEVKADQRPVLAAAMKSAVADVSGETEPQEIHGYVLDLRGKTPPPSDFFKEGATIKLIEARIGVESPLLILGDDPSLDTWKWLELDRPRHRSPRPGVVWLPDGSLPPSMDAKLRLMQLFTEWNIPLTDISQE